MTITQKVWGLESNLFEILQIFIYKTKELMIKHLLLILKLSKNIILKLEIKYYAKRA